MSERVTIKPGYGYWDTTSYPIGGNFRRASKATGLEVTITETIPAYKGADTLGATDDGRTVAFLRSHAE